MGPQTQIVQVRIHKLLPRIAKPRIRGGPCLVIIEGIVIRAKKVKSTCEVLNLDLSWLDLLAELASKVRSKGQRSTQKDSKYSLSIGRPILSVNDQPQSFKLRIGTSSTTSICGCNLHPKAIDLLGFY